MAKTLTQALKDAEVTLEGAVYPSVGAPVVFGRAYVRVDMSDIDTLVQDGVSTPYDFRQFAVDCLNGRYTDAMKTVVRRAVHRAWPLTVGSEPLFSGVPAAFASEDRAGYHIDFECRYADAR